ncbi:PREDICTED: uncharacterized protein LOC109243861 [Nicotiana attenuata]|uniref:uncharacterized protein LOC109243861 n=1 Tax=Nicotiana attenuata TaxID=49451 RepID=UPI0009055046|nr:PREDICTED: uncharacterized protein LOC109243861 [Nicotiana attenuata]
MEKTPEEIVTILDELSEDANQWPSESAERRRSTGFHQVDANTFMQRVPGTLPSDTERNPKEPVNDVTLRSGQVLKEKMWNLKKKAEQLKTDVDKKKKSKKGVEKKNKEEVLRREEPEESKHMPVLPFLQKLYREKLDNQFEKFLDMLKQVHVNLTFTKVLSQMQAYTKLLKKILTKKRKIEETSVVKLKEHCSAMLQKKLPQMCGDPGNFTIACC